jgi:hypothetical protein
VGLEDVFISLGEKDTIKQKLQEQQNRFLDSLNLISRKTISLTISLIKSKKNILKMDKIKLFNHFRPKNRDSK